MWGCSAPHGRRSALALVGAFVAERAARARDPADVPEPFKPSPVTLEYREVLLLHARGASRGRVTVIAVPSASETTWMSPP